MNWCHEVGGREVQRATALTALTDDIMWVEQGGCSVQNAATKRSCRAAEIPPALERTSRRRSYSSHTALSRTARPSYINQAVRMQRAAIPAVYAGAWCCGMRDGSRRECVRSSVIGLLSDWCRMQPPCCHSTALWPCRRFIGHTSGNERPLTSLEERVQTWSRWRQLLLRHHSGPGPELKDTNPTEADLLCQELPPSHSELNALSGHTGS